MPTPQQPTDDEIRHLIQIDPSKIRAQLITASSLLFFAFTTMTTIIGLLRRGQIEEAREFLVSQPGITGATAIASIGWFVYRWLNSKWQKEREIVIASTSPLATLSKPITEEKVVAAMASALPDASQEVVDAVVTVAPTLPVGIKTPENEKPAPSRDAGETTTAEQED